MIRRVGEFLRLDDEGFFINESKTPILQPWLPVVDETVNVYCHHIKDKIHSIYIRGSVARGTAIEGISDVDSFAVVFGGSKDIDTTWFEEFEQYISSKYPFTTVDMRCINHKALIRPDRLKFLKFVIKIQSICVFGDNLARIFPKYRPTLDVVWHLYRIEDNLRTVKERLALTNNHEEIELQCQWIMKRLVRSGGELLIEDELAYSRDLYPCYELFSKYYPTEALNMWRALEMAINPTTSKSEILNFLDDFGYRFCELARRKLNQQSQN